MTVHRQLLPENGRIQRVNVADEVVNASSDVVFTREHDVIRQWAEARHAEPATGEATPSGPPTVHVNDGGAGIRLIFRERRRFGQSVGRSGSRTSTNITARSCVTTTARCRSATGIGL